jgi:hypothetical protein
MWLPPYKILARQRLQYTYVHVSMLLIVRKRVFRWVCKGFVLGGPDRALLRFVSEPEIRAAEFLIVVYD